MECNDSWFSAGTDQIHPKNFKTEAHFFLSNINALHEEAVLQAYAKISQDSFFSLFEKVYYSHRTGLRKPEKQTFRSILIENGLDPAKTLFVDDSKHHVLGAIQEGIHAIHLTADKTIEALLSEIEI